MRWPWQRRSSSPAPGSAHRPHRRRWPWIVLGVVLVLMVVGRLIAPMLIETIVEKSLENMEGGYRGTVEGVDLRMLDAEVALLGLRIEKKGGRIPVPFIDAKELVVGTVRDSWKPRSTLRVESPVISIVDAESEAMKQTGPKFDPAQLRKQLPFELLWVHVNDAAIHFRNYQTKPDLDMAITNLNLAWDEMVGCVPPGSAACNSTIDVEGDVLKGGKLAAHGTFARKPEVQLDMRTTLRNLRAAQLSPATRHYAKIDMQKGEIELDAKLKRRGEAFSALLVPRFHDVEVLGGDEKGVRFGRELGVAAAAGWLERKEGKKGIALKSKPGGGMDYEVVDLKSDKDDDKKDDDKKKD